MIDVTTVAVWGLLATVLLTLAMALSQQAGWSRMSLPFMLGTAFSPRRGRAMAAGFAVHFLLGLAFAFIYALAFETLGRASWWLGGTFGLFHGLAMLVLGVPLVASLHPRMASKHHGPTPTRQLEPPGFMALHYGHRTPLVSLLAHVLFGLLLGAVYTP